jgi:predicted enzyme related to lactoylglutathione lyase
MNYTTKLLFTLLIATGCNAPTDKSTETAETQKTEIKKTVVIDTTPKVTGIGGIFFFTDDAKATKEWYSKNLGLISDQYGSTFEFRNANDPDQINYLEWSPFKKGSKYFAPSNKDFMINYRVQNLEGLLRQFKANGVTICDTVQTVEYGKFVHIIDNEGTKIELWEPIDSVLTKMGGKTNK